MNSVRCQYFALLSLLIFGATPSLGDGFSESLTHNEIHFTQWQTDELHQEPITSPDGRLIGYMHIEERDPGKRRLWVMGRDGKDARPLVVEPRSHMQAYPKWSPDGQHIAFTSDLGGETSIWTVRVADGTLKKITDHHLGTDVFGCAATWSPDSQTLVVNAADNNNAQLLKYSIAGGLPDTLFEARSIAFPAWSPSGDRIVFNGATHERGNFWYMTVSDRTVHPLDAAGRSGHYLAWSPAGDWLAFQSDGAKPHIILLPAEGGQPIQVTDTTLVSAARTVAWDYDGKSLLYSAHPRNNGFSGYLAMVDTSGSNFVVLADVNHTVNVAWQWPPCWTPNEDFLAFTPSGEDSTIAIVSTKGGAKRVLAKGTGQAFSPDGTEIAFVHERAIWATDLRDIDPYPITLAFPDEVSNLEWSPDGEWIIFRKRNTLWKVSSYGGESTPLFEDRSLAFTVGWSTNSQSFYYVTPRTAGGESVEGWGGIWRVSTVAPSAGEYVKDNIGWSTDISSDESFLASGDLMAKNGLRLYRFATGQTKTIRFHQKPDYSVASTSISPSGTRVAFYLVREWFLSTWRADVSNLIGQPVGFP